MKLSIKIFAPLVLLLCLSIIGFLIILHSLQIEEQFIITNATTIQKLNTLNTQLDNLQYRADFDVLSYRFTKEKSLLDDINETVLEKSVILDTMSPLMRETKGRALVRRYIAASIGLEQARNDLLFSINTNNVVLTEINFTKWNLQTQSINEALSDIDAYNTNVFEQDLNSVEQTRQWLFLVVSIFALIMMSVCVLLFFYFRKVITKPLIKLEKASQKVAAGDLLAYVDVTSSDEVGILSRTFNEMTKKLFDFYQKEKKEEADKDEFISIAAHQLRTPLGIQRWTLERLLAQKYGKLSRKVKEQVDDVYISVLKLIKLVNDLLDVSRITQGRVENKPISFDLRMGMNRTVRELRGLASVHHVLLIANTGKQPIFAHVDPELFHVVLENLLSNAIKYNKEYGTVTISLKMLSGTVQIKIVDTGIGIAQKDQSRIFEKFQRGTNAVKYVTEGTGLGLFIVKFYVESWKGHVSLVSALGKGTTVTIDLPSKKS